MCVQLVDTARLVLVTRPYARRERTILLREPLPKRRVEVRRPEWARGGHHTVYYRNHKCIMAELSAEAFNR